MRIAMWSGPRNLSTAMMYAFAARKDCAVLDEPFYAAYLAATGLDHPMRAEILASQPQDPEAVVRQITGSIPAQKPHFYQKHMTQHMLPGMPRGWMRDFANVFLIRHPARVIASYAAKREAPALADIGFVQQADLFDDLRASGQEPLVIDSHDIRENPAAMLRLLCEALGLEWDPAMLHWPSGGIAEDGVWAAHWYGAVHRSTGFAGREGPLPHIEGPLRQLEQAAMPAYEHLEQFKLKG